MPASRTPCSFVVCCIAVACVVWAAAFAGTALARQATLPPELEAAPPTAKKKPAVKTPAVKKPSAKKPARKSRRKRRSQSAKQPVRVAPSHAPGAAWRDPVTGMEFVWVPGGCYQMGQSPEEKRRLLSEMSLKEYEKGHTDELPLHRVCVDGFWMGKYEVTNAQFRKFRPRHDSGKTKKGASLNHDRQPVVEVGWNDAQQFADWLTRKSSGRFRLPTEAEWEYACRAGTRTARYWGNDYRAVCLYANVMDVVGKRAFPDYKHTPIARCADGYQVAAPVGMFKPNAFGLYDMIGNAWEWNADAYGKNACSSHGQSNPKHTAGAERVRRGGCWWNTSNGQRCAQRSSSKATKKANGQGFRLVRQE